MKVEMKRLPHYQQTELPQFQTDGACAVDLYANCEQDVILHSLQKGKIPSGIAISLPPNVAAVIIPRSSTGSKGFSLSNSVGLIDSDYQGEIGIEIRNTSDESITIEKGMRLAQMLFLPVLKPEFVEVSEFSTTTARGENGWGSTGK